MRTTKFKAWDNESGQFVKDVSQFTLKDLENRSERYDFLQYTGSPDKDGVEIFEGDIMDADHQAHAKGIVVYEDGQFRLWSGRGTTLQECYDLPVLSKMFNVVGNIYENPEMVPAKELAEESV